MVATTNSNTLAERVLKMEPVSVPQEELVTINQFNDAMRRVLRSPTPRRACQFVSADGMQVEIPEAVFQFVVRIAEVLASGDAVTVIPVDKLFSTQQAADILNVSRQHIVDLLSEGKIPHHLVGKHRRVKVEDLLSYKALRDERRHTTLGKMVHLSEELGLYETPEAELAGKAPTDR